MHDLESGGTEKDLAQQSPAFSSNSVQPIELDCPYFLPLCHPQTLLTMTLYILTKNWGNTKGIEPRSDPWRTLGAYYLRFIGEMA